MPKAGRPWLRKAIGLLLLCAGWMLFSSPGAVAANPGPSAVIGNFCAQLLNVMQHASALGAKGRYQKLEPIVTSTFDIPFMSRLSIGPTWYRLTPDQKKRAAAAYARYLTAVYASQFDDYAGQKFQVLGDEKIKHGTLVRTQIVKANGESVAINYVMHDNDIAWQIRDLYIGDAISELATRRSEFSGILRTSGIDGLIAAMNKKADDLQTTTDQPSNCRPQRKEASRPCRSSTASPNFTPR
jgi:phospholipid transport system substrate-binding protein